MQTRVEKTPVVAEKPYVVVIGEQWNLIVPPVEFDKSGQTTDWYASATIDFTHIYVATDRDSAQTINAKLG